jgi:hypothetical protein
MNCPPTYFDGCHNSFIWLLSFLWVTQLRIKWWFWVTPLLTKGYPEEVVYSSFNHYLFPIFATSWDQFNSIYLTCKFEKNITLPVFCFGINCLENDNFYMSICKQWFFCSLTHLSRPFFSNLSNWSNWLIPCWCHSIKTKTVTLQ